MAAAVADGIELHRLSSSSSQIIRSEEEGELYDGDTSSNNNKKNTRSSQKHVGRSYLSLLGIAVLLMILTPRSKLWICTNDQHNVDDCKYYGSLNLSVLMKPALWITVLILSYLNLRGSDPGILTKEVMERYSEIDNFRDDDNNSREEGDIDNNDMERQIFLEPTSPPSSSPSPLDVAASPSEKNNSNTRLYRSTRRKYCAKCNHHPPLRSHHCSTCNICVATFDHNCHFLGACIGERNHWRFWCFLFLNMVTLKTALDVVNSSNMTLSAYLLHDDKGNDTGSGSKSSDEVSLALATCATVIAKLYMYPILIIVWILLAIHTFMAIQNCTTFEFTKGAAHIDYLSQTKMMDFPFGRDGLCSNLFVFFRRDDAYRSLCSLASKVKVGWSGSADERWSPLVWKIPDYIDRESEEWWKHPMQNKYWQCC